MARFLVAVWPIPGHYLPNLAVATALRARGHEVAFLTGSRARAAVEGQGFECFTFRRVDERGLDRVFFESRPPPRWWQPALAVQRARTRDWLVGLLPGQVPDVEDAIEAWKPDAIVCDPTLWGVFLVIPERRRIPVAIFAYVSFCPAPGPGIPPLGLGLPRARTAAGRLRVAAARLLFRAATGDFRRAANALRGRFSLPPLDVTPTEFALRAPLYLVAGTPRLDFERTDLPASVRYVGPCAWERPRSGPPPEWLMKSSRDQPLVCVSEGTIHTGVPFLSRAAVRGLGGLPARVLVSTGSPVAEAARALGPLPANVRLEHWVDIHLSDVLPVTDLVVTTGGAGTVLASLGAGVPLILVPTEWDKPDVAARVVATGTGLRLSPSRCSPARLRASVERVLGDSSFRDAARGVGADLARYGGAGEAARLLEELSAQVVCRSRTTGNAPATPTRPAVARTTHAAGPG